MHGATIKIEYKLTIENECDVDLKNIKLWDCLNYKSQSMLSYSASEEFLTDSLKNNSSENWQVQELGSKNCLYTTINEIKANTSVDKELIVSKLISADNDETYYENFMMLESLEYINSDSENKKMEINIVNEENINKNNIIGGIESAYIIIIPPTGI